MNTSTETAVHRGRWIIWMAFPLALLVLGGYIDYGTANYAALPGTIPTHWGPDGSADAFAPKTVGTTFGMLFGGIGLTALLAFICAVVPAMSPQRGKPSDYELYRREGMVRGTIAALGLTSLGLAVLFGTVAVAGWHGAEEINGWPSLLFVVAILGMTVTCFVVAGRWSRRVAAAAGVAPTAREAAEERLWVAGLLYNNPEDPDIMVPKRAGTGAGWTVNIGHPKGKAALIMFLVLVIGVPLGLGVAAGL